MSEQPRESVRSMSEDRLKELHLWKELLSNEEVRDRYTLLRISGASPDQARRWRHWSPKHFQMMVAYLCEPNRPLSSGSQLS